MRILLFQWKPKKRWTVQELNEEETRWTGFREVMGLSGPIILGSLSYTIMRFVGQTVVSRPGAEALALWPLSGPLFHSMRHSPEVTRLEPTFFRI